MKFDLLSPWKYTCKAKNPSVIIRYMMVRKCNEQSILLETRFNEPVHGLPYLKHTGSRPSLVTVA